MTIRTFSTLTSEVRSYINHIKLPSSEIDRFLYYTYHYPQRLQNTSFITIGDPIQGVIATHPEELNHRSYQRIRLLHGDTDQIRSDLVEASLDQLQGTKHRGLFTTQIPRLNRVPDPAFINNQFNIELRWRQSTPKQLKTTTQPDSQLQAVKYDRTAKHQLRRLFIQLLTEHDERINQLRNKCFGQDLLPTNLKRNKANQIKLSYFVDQVATDNQWHAYLLFSNQRPIGIIKAYVDRTHKTTSVDLHLQPGHQHHSTGAYHLLAKSLITARVKVIQLGVYESDIEQTKIANKLFGNTVADQYFHLI